MDVLTRRQREIFNFLRDNYDSFAYPPSLDQLCAALGMASRGSLYKHIMVLIEAGLVEPFMGKKKGGVRLTAQAQNDNSTSEQGLPFIGSIAAGKPIEAVATISYMTIPLVKYCLIKPLVFSFKPRSQEQ
jgi:repressor LexA